MTGKQPNDIEAFKIVQEKIISKEFKIVDSLKYDTMKNAYEMLSCTEEDKDIQGVRAVMKWCASMKRQGIPFVMFRSKRYGKNALRFFVDGERIFTA